jgi:hypothetical protein
MYVQPRLPLPLFLTQLYSAALKVGFGFELKFLSRLIGGPKKAWLVQGLLEPISEKGASSFSIRRGKIQSKFMSQKFFRCWTKKVVHTFLQYLRFFVAQIFIEGMEIFLTHIYVRYICTCCM